MKGKITFSGEICDFELITRKDLIERGYRYMEKVSGIFYKEHDINFNVPKDEYFTEVKLVQRIVRIAVYVYGIKNYKLQKSVIMNIIILSII